MTAAPHSIGKDQPLAVAGRVMRLHSIRHLPVLDENKLVGILSERDVHLVGSVAGVDLEQVAVERGMHEDVYCVSPESRVEDVVTQMADHRYGSVAVVEHGKVIGLFTTTDALRLLARQLHESGDS